MRFNQVAIAGRLTKDPELKNTPSGTAVCHFRIAFDQGSGDNKKAGYVDVSSFQKVAENASKYLKKGSAVMVGGRIEYQEWKNNEGQNRSALKVIAHDVQFLDPKKQENSDDGGRFMDPPAGLQPRTDGW